MYKTHENIVSPVLLANKANSATIDSGGGDLNSAAAVQKAIESSTSGAIKLLQLIGALLHHKDGERGYQHIGRIFLREQKLELYNLDETGNFPDVSNTQYSSYTYAAAEVVCYHRLIQELVEEVMDAKTKSGQANHVEQNILKGLNCRPTMTELVVLSLSSMSVSWPYMAQVRGTKEKPVNLLSLTDLHRKLPTFCAHIAANPHILLDLTTPQQELTIDGKLFLDDFLLESIQELQPDLPNLNLIVSSMFSGTETGWIIFTPEIQVGGTFDSLTPEQLAVLHIPSTNDCSEGMLGTFRVHMRYHPNSTAYSFSNQTRAERNNTEAFIKKHCDKLVGKYIMCEVRKDGASGRQAKFWKAWVVLQREKAEKGVKKQVAPALKKQTKAMRLAATMLELDVSKINKMTSAVLKDQLAVYRDVLKDPVLIKKLWKDMATVDVCRNLVLEAQGREMARWTAVNEMPTPRDVPEPMEDVAVDEYGYSAADDDEWEDE
ncbi:hypothetical protein DFH07DRAFT_971113 [Mycena maculata]|uniref:Uncharacterized protein n=1 Tax=Mycena maculata TaxID=230809 RepID=A0AAD7HPN5_9AGAR|nr:hypothetical protein DFH07DRAFT_971113 [Mycena maculata]